ncbi:MAG: choice-of-anchor Q domain-containing protein, partial [Lentisphaerota bacterium]
QRTSPCIHRGDNALVMGDVDLDGNARISGGVVDLGAYEYSAETNGIRPPSLSAPVAVAAGSNAILVVTNWTACSVSGGKSNGTWAVRNWTTDGIVQTPAGTTWSEPDVLLQAAPGGFTNVLTYRGTTGDLVLFSAQVTELRIVNHPPLPEAPGATPVHFVSLAGGNLAPYTNWAQAARTIQAAVDIAQDGDTVLVTNGVYAVGGKSASWHPLTNRVMIAKNIRVESVNGPAVTTIEGAGPGGESAVRCVYMTSNATLVGFTMSGGHTKTSSDWEDDLKGAGAYVQGQGRLVNCVLRNNVAESLGGGAFAENYVQFTDCTVVSNTAGFQGGGVFLALYSRMDGCLVADNHAGNGPETGEGGGVYIYGYGWVIDSTVTNNAADADGGGIYLHNFGKTVASKIVDNHAGWNGGGVVCRRGGEAHGCVIRGNTAAYWRGGGAYLKDGDLSGAGILANCLITGNSADMGGGVCTDESNRGGLLQNCTIAGNTANGSGGGVCADESVAGQNTIVYFNTATDFSNTYTWGTSLAFDHCCVAPDPGGSYNLTALPAFVNANAGDYHLQEGSPCVDAGVAHELATHDLDGVVRPLDGTGNGTAEYDIGAYELASYGSDTDGDSLNDSEEVHAAGTNPTLSDTDGDGMPDGWEVLGGLNPLVDDALQDPDGDGEASLDEYFWCTMPARPDAALWSADLADAGAWGTYQVLFMPNSNGTAIVLENGPQSWGYAWTYVGHVDVSVYRNLAIDLTNINGTVIVALCGPDGANYQEFMATTQRGTLIKDVSSWMGNDAGVEDVFVEIVVVGEGAFGQFRRVSLGRTLEWREEMDHVSEWNSWNASLTGQSNGVARQAEAGPGVWGKSWVYVGRMDVSNCNELVVDLKALSGVAKVALSGPGDSDYREFLRLTAPGRYATNVITWQGNRADAEDVYAQLIIEGQNGSATYNDLWLRPSVFWAAEMTNVGGWYNWRAGLAANGDGTATQTENGTNTWGKSWTRIGYVDLSTWKYLRVRIKSLTAFCKVAISGSSDANYQEFLETCASGEYVLNLSTWIGNQAGVEDVYLQLVVEGDGASVVYDDVTLERSP